MRQGVFIQMPFCSMVAMVSRAACFEGHPCGGKPHHGRDPRSALALAAQLSLPCTGRDAGLPKIPFSLLVLSPSSRRPFDQMPAEVSFPLGPAVSHPRAFLPPRGHGSCSVGPWQCEALGPNQGAGVCISLCLAPPVGSRAGEGLSLQVSGCL